MKSSKDYQKNQLEKLKKRISEAQEAGYYPCGFKLPIALQFELTAACNLDCLHCYNRSGDSDKINEQKMSPQKWIDFTNYLIRAGGIFYVIISGGEPLLLGEHLFDIMEPLHKDGTIFTFITNGYLMNENIIKKLRKYRFNRFQVSIDSNIPELHDWFRQKKGSWEKAVNAALLASKYGLPLTIATTIFPENLSRLEEIAEFAYSLGASSLIVGEVMYSGRAIKNPDIMLNETQQKEFHKSIKQIIKKWKKRMEIVIGMSEDVAINIQRIYPLDSAIIRPNGDIRIDCTLPVTIGNILEEDFISIWNKKAPSVWNNEIFDIYLEHLKNKDSKGIINHVTKDIRI